MKVGIITFHHTTNYGATLQAYALWKTIKHQGHEVEIIDYRPHIAVRVYWREIKLILKNKFRLLIKPEALVTLVKLLVKQFKKEFFLYSKVKLSKKKAYTREDLSNFNLDYDIVICGSDQLWCIDSFRGFDPSFFLDFVDSQKCRKISYAASFGGTKDLGEYRELINKLISDFHAISVRDFHSLRLLQKECGKSGTRVLDPTFLIDFNELKSVSKLKKEYLVIYFHRNLTVEQENFIKSIAKLKDLIIISVWKYSSIASKNFLSLAPQEWLTYINNASYVVTDTYHGTIFSIKSKKLFTVFSREDKINKINDLLDNLGLESRLLVRVDSDSVDIQSQNINYAVVDEKLEKEILISKTYLFETLDSKEGPSKAKTFQLPTKNK